MRVFRSDGTSMICISKQELGNAYLCDKHFITSSYGTLTDNRIIFNS